MWERITFGGMKDVGSREQRFEIGILHGGFLMSRRKRFWTVASGQVWVLWFMARSREYDL